ncbi:hypothetical protein GGI24_006603, partial [Coemansia furcata]
MTNLKRSLISLLFAVGLASATNAVGAKQHDAASVVVQHAQAFESHVPSFDSPPKKFNHAVASAAPMQGAFVTPTQFANSFAHSLPSLAPSNGKPQQPMAGNSPIYMQANQAPHSNRNTPAAAKLTQRASAVNSAGIAGHPAGKNFLVAIAVAALAANAANVANAAWFHAAAIMAVGAVVVKEVDTVADTVVMKVGVDAVDAADAATTVANLVVSAATTVATTVAHVAVTMRSHAVTTAAADVVVRADTVDTVDTAVDTVDTAVDTA